MRRRNAVTLFVIVGALLVASVASVAVAKNISCNKARCVGTNDRDHITASDRSQTITAKGGNDTVFALGGTDTVRAGSGNDRVSGGAGDDQLFGQSGDDTLNDTVGPTTGLPSDRDVVAPGSGDNQVDVADGDTLDKVCQSPGATGVTRSDPGDEVGPLVEC